MTSRRISVAFAVLYAAGSRWLRAAGAALISRTPFTPAAALSGILSRRAGVVRAAITGGNGRIVCAVIVCRRTKRGMKTRRTSGKFMQYAWYDVVGLTGVALIIVTYVFLQLEKVRSETLIYSLLNAAGASLIIVSLIYNFNFSAFIVEFFWLLISLFGIGKYFLRKRN